MPIYTFIIYDYYEQNELTRVHQDTELSMEQLEYLLKNLNRKKLYIRTYSHTLVKTSEISANAKEG